MTLHFVVSLVDYSLFTFKALTFAMFEALYPSISELTESEHRSLPRDAYA